MQIEERSNKELCECTSDVSYCNKSVRWNDFLRLDWGRKCFRHSWMFWYILFSAYELERHGNHSTTADYQKCLMEQRRSDEVSMVQDARFDSRNGDNFCRMYLQSMANWMDKLLAGQAPLFLNLQLTFPFWSILLESNRRTKAMSTFSITIFIPFGNPTQILRSGIPFGLLSSTPLCQPGAWLTWMSRDWLALVPPINSA